MANARWSLDAAERVLAFELDEAIQNNHLLDMAGKCQAQPDGFLQMTGTERGDIALYSRTDGKLIFTQDSSSPFIGEAINLLPSHEGHELNSIETAIQGTACVRSALTVRHWLPAECRAFSIMIRSTHEVHAPELPASVHVSQASQFDASGLDLIAGFSLDRLGKRRSEDECRALLDSASRRFFGLHVDGRIRAIAALTRSIGRARCISFVYTTPDGRRRGWARQLLLQVLAACKGLHDPVFLQVEQDNETAIALYHSLGWKTATRFTVMDMKRQRR